METPKTIFEKFAYSTCVLLFTALPLFSQGLKNNGANIIQSEGYIVISNNNGGYTTNTTSTTNLNGDGIIMSGNLSINGAGTVNCPSCTLKLNGSSNQDILTDGNSFGNIEVENSTGINLLDDLTTTAKLILTDGVITTGNNMTIMTSTSSSDLIGGSNGAFVYGTLRRYFTQNSDIYTFPVGQGTSPTEYFPADFINDDLDLTGSDYLTVSVDKINEVLGDDELINTFSGSTPIINVYQEAEWTITPQNDAIVSGEYGVNLWFDNITEAMYDDHFTVVKRDESSNSYIDWDAYAGSIMPADGFPGRTVSSGFAQKTGFTSFSKFAIGAGGSELPVELVSFSATENEDIVYLEWATESESNNESFTIEKSKDGWDFEEVITLAGAGNSNELIEYNAIDNNPYEGISYYRLKQTDYDGKFEYSKLAPVFIQKEFNFSVWPNPAVDYLAIDILNSKESRTNSSNSSEQYFITILNANGTTIISETSEQVNTQYKINVSDLPSGMYFLIVQSDEKIFKQNFVKQ